MHLLVASLNSVCAIEEPEGLVSATTFDVR